MRASLWVACVALVFACGREERVSVPEAAPVASAPVDPLGRLDPAPYRPEIEAAENFSTPGRDSRPTAGRRCRRHCSSCTTRSSFATSPRTPETRARSSSSSPPARRPRTAGTTAMPSSPSYASSGSSSARRDSRQRIGCAQRRPPPSLDSDADLQSDSQRASSPSRFWIQRRYSSAGCAPVIAVSVPAICTAGTPPTPSSTAWLCSSLTCWSNAGSAARANSRSGRPDSSQIARSVASFEMSRLRAK